MVHVTPGGLVPIDLIDSPFAHSSRILLYKNEGNITKRHLEIGVKIGIIETKCNVNVAKIAFSNELPVVEDIFISLLSFK